MNFKNVKFALLTTFLVLLAHAIAYLSHEYTHSFLAWILGFKINPLALNYGEPTLHNIILLGDIDENVDYKHIIETGNSMWGGVIALAGAGIGNGLLYFLCYWLSKFEKVRSSRGLVMFLFWLSLMGSANLLSYAPLRVITNHGDMAIAANCFNISPWLLFPFVTAGTIYLMYHFFFKMFPQNYQLVSGSGLNLIYTIVMTSYWYFGFFGSDGTTILPIILKFFFIPFSAMFLASKYLKFPTISEQKSNQI